MTTSFLLTVILGPTGAGALLTPGVVSLGFRPAMGSVDVGLAR